MFLIRLSYIMAFLTLSATSTGDSLLATPTTVLCTLTGEKRTPRDVLNASSTGGDAVLSQLDVPAGPAVARSASTAVISGAMKDTVIPHGVLPALATGIDAIGIETASAEMGIARDFFTEAGEGRRDAPSNIVMASLPPGVTWPPTVGGGGYEIPEGGGSTGAAPDFDTHRGPSVHYDDPILSMPIESPSSEPVPEPSTLVLVAVGGGAVACGSSARRRRK